MTGFARFFKLLAAWLWPPACAACHVRLPGDGGPVLCAACYRKLPWWRTDVVLKPDWPRAVDGFFAPFLYEGVVRELILRFKFADGMALAPLLAGWLAEQVPDGDVLLVPVPSHVSRLRWRGYSHTAVLVRALAKRLAGERKTGNGVRAGYSLTALRRLTKSDGQAAKTRKQRLLLRGTDFAADVAQVAGKRVVLVDDIVTTGGTARACALALRKAGAAEVVVLAVAYTPPGREVNAGGGLPQGDEAGRVAA